MADPIIKIRGLRREFPAGEQTVTVLDGVDLDVFAGEMIAISGQSGSGKSTLMNIMGCLDRGWTGSYSFKGRDVARLDANELAALRREHFGFIFQRYQLLPDLTATENVEVPAIYAGAHTGERRQRAQALLTRLGLGERFDYRPATLSGGQQQRVSVARALMNGGDVILADEPTGALDSKTSEDIMRLLADLNAQGMTVVIVTHEADIAAWARRRLVFRDGLILEDTRSDPSSGPDSDSAARSTAAGKLESDPHPA